MESSWRGISQGHGVGLDYGKVKEVLWGSEIGICLYCCFLSPLTTGWTRTPQVPEGLFS